MGNLNSTKKPYGQFRLRVAYCHAYYPLGVIAGAVVTLRRFSLGVGMQHFLRFSAAFAFVFI